MRAKSDKQAKASSLTLSWPRNALFDDAAAEVGVDQAASCAFDGGNQTVIGDAILTSEPRKRFGLEDAYKLFSNSINYSS
jgi:hypothetical protein